MKVNISFSKVSKKELLTIEEDLDIRCGIEYEFKLNSLLDGVPSSVDFENISEEIQSYKQSLADFGREIAEKKENWFREFRKALKKEISNLEEVINSSEIENFSTEDFDWKRELKKVAETLEYDYLTFVNRDEAAEVYNLSEEDFYESYYYVDTYSVHEMPEEIRKKLKYAGLSFSVIDDIDLDSVPSSSGTLDRWFEVTIDREIDLRLRNEYMSVMEEKTIPNFEAPLEIFLDIIESREQQESIYDSGNEIVEYLKSYDWSLFPVGLNPHIGSYHSGVFLNGWRIEPDSSLDNEGVEIISPPKDLEETFEDMEQMFRAIKVEGFTDSKCGLHINLSMPGMEKMNLAKLLLFVDEGYVDAFFEDRRNSNYVNFLDFLIEETKGKVQKHDIKNYKEIEKLIVDSYRPKKYNAVNIESFKNYDEESNRIEFRYLGARDYEKKYDKIKTQVLKYAYYMKIACDPSYKRKEYLTKLMRLRIKTGGLNFDPKTAEKIKEGPDFVAYRVGKKIVRVAKREAAPTLLVNENSIILYYSKGSKNLSERIYFSEEESKRSIAKRVLFIARKKVPLFISSIQLQIRNILLNHPRFS